MSDNTIKDAINAEIARRGWTMHKLSTEAGVAYQTIHPYLTGYKGRGIASKGLQKIMDTLGLELKPKGD